MASSEPWALNTGLALQQALHVTLPFSLSRRPQWEGGQILCELEMPWVGTAQLPPFK